LKTFLIWLMREIFQNLFKVFINFLRGFSQTNNHMKNQIKNTFINHIMRAISIFSFRPFVIKLSLQGLISNNSDRKLFLEIQVTIILTNKN
jgi:hypothetical protein